MGFKPLQILSLLTGAAMSTSEIARDLDLPPRNDGERPLYVQTLASEMVRRAGQRRAGTGAEAARGRGHPCPLVIAVVPLVLRQPLVVVPRQLDGAGGTRVRCAGPDRLARVPLDVLSRVASYDVLGSFVGPAVSSTWSRSARP